MVAPICLSVCHLPKNVRNQLQQGTGFLCVLGKGVLCIYLIYSILLEFIGNFLLFYLQKK